MRPAITAAESSIFLKESKTVNYLHSLFAPGGLRERDEHLGRYMYGVEIAARPRIYFYLSFWLRTGR